MTKINLSLFVILALIIKWQIFFPKLKRPKWDMLSIPLILAIPAICIYEYFFTNIIPVAMRPLALMVIVSMVLYFILYFYPKWLWPNGWPLLFFWIHTWELLHSKYIFLSQPSFFLTLLTLEALLMLGRPIQGQQLFYKWFSVRVFIYFTLLIETYFLRGIASKENLKWIFILILFFFLCSLVEFKKWESLKKSETLLFLCAYLTFGAILVLTLLNLGPLFL
jgi:hypothetical protein